MGDGGIAPSHSSVARSALGHRVLETDLYAERWKAVFDADDFLARVDPERLSFVGESGHAFATGTQTADVPAHIADH